MEKVLTKEDSGALKGVAVLLMVFHHCFRSKEKFAAYSLLFTPFHVKTIIHLARWAKICVPIWTDLCLQKNGKPFSWRGFSLVKKTPDLHFVWILVCCRCFLYCSVSVWQTEFKQMGR